MQTFGPVLTIKKIKDEMRQWDNLYLVREKEWLCVLNRCTKYYTRILKIPSYIF